MESSQQYLNRCLDTIKMDKNLSETTFILMFQEYARLVVEDNIKKEAPNLYESTLKGTLRGPEIYSFEGRWIMEYGRKGLFYIKSEQENILKSNPLKYEGAIRFFKVIVENRKSMAEIIDL